MVKPFPLNIANRNSSQKGVRYVNLRLLDLLKKSLFFKKHFVLIPPKYCCACLRIWSRETGSADPSRASLLISILRLNLVLTYGIPPEFRGSVHMKPSYAIGSVPSLSGHAVAYRWRSLPRVRRHRASKPQGSSERVLPWQITMDQLIFASLSHTHYWYEVSMLKVLSVTDPAHWPF